MKKILLVTMALLATQMISYSSVSVDESTSERYLINEGYSKATADFVKIGKAAANGRECYTDAEKKANSQNKFVKFWRKAYVYLDPAAEDYSMYHHDNKAVPSYTDL